MRARIRWTQKASKEAAEVSRAGLFTSTPLNLAAASTSSSSTTREQDLTNTRAGKGGSVVLGGLDTLEKTFGGFWRTSLPQKLCVSLDAGFCKLFFVILDFLPQNQRTYLWLLINYVVLEENEVYRRAP